MTRRSFETILARHCAPVLLGKKPANLVSVAKRDIPALMQTQAHYARELSRHGVCMKTICACGKHFLILVYRPAPLSKCLAAPGAAVMLLSDGYRPDWPLERMFDKLKERFEERREFPHEIGLFLGYPIEDVRGFRRDGGASCKFCGYWKVYGDVDEAKRLFVLYDRCREYVTARLSQGATILQLLDEKASAA